MPPPAKWSNPTNSPSWSRNLTAFALDIQRLLGAGKVVTVGDIADTNGSAQELTALLAALGVLPRLHGYAGWNTSGNTLGTAIAMGVQSQGGAA